MVGLGVVCWVVWSLLLGWVVGLGGWVECYVLGWVLGGGYLVVSCSRLCESF